MATTLCLINQKGGCGKSSTCFHLAGAFAAGGMQVLLIDLDPQGSLSQGFLGSATVENLPPQETVAALFNEGGGFPDPSTILRPTPLSSITLCPANQHLALFNTPAPEHTGLSQYALREFLREVSGRFDMILVDCPPNPYRCNWVAMVGSDHVIIPVPPEDFGTQGLRAVHQAIEAARRLRPELRRLGHLVTRCDRRLLIHRHYEQRLRTLYRHLVLDTVIPEVSAFKVALAERRPVEFHDPQSVAAERTRRLADEILHRVQGSHARRRVA